jgi:hypothetical protein
MSRNAPPDELVQCGNCQALNPPNSIVCLSCGVDLVGYQKSAGRLQELKDQHASIQLAEFSEVAAQAAQSEIAQGRARTALLLRTAFVIAAIISTLAIVTAAFLGIGVRQRTERLTGEFDQAKDCFAAQDYECARDILIKLLDEEPAYPEARPLLNDTRYRLAVKHVETENWLAAISELESLYRELPPGEMSYSGAPELLFTARSELARQYAQATEWQLAIDQLDILQREAPDNPAVTIALKDVYDRWIAYAVGEGDILTAVLITLQRDARFPPKEE